MTYFEVFKGDYEAKMAEVYARRQAVIDRAKQLEPANTDELLAASQNGDFDHELDWVEVPNPLYPEEGNAVTVRPVMYIDAGYPEAEQEKNRRDKGVWQIGIEALLPSGDAHYVGGITFFYTDQKLKQEPSISISSAPGNSSRDMSGPLRWDSADAALLLSMIESALQAQPAQ